MKTRDLSPGRTLRLMNRLNFELGEKTFPPETCPDKNKSLRQETLLFKDPDILGIRSARWDATVSLQHNKYLRGTTGTKHSEWKLSNAEPGMFKDRSIAQEHASVYLSNSRYETDILGATQPSRSLVFSKDELPGPWNSSTYIDRFHLEKQNKEKGREILSKTRGRSQVLVPERPSLTQRYEADLQATRERKEQDRIRAKERAEIFGGEEQALSLAASRYPDGYRANMHARGTRADKIAVLALDDWEAQGLPASQRDSGNL